MNKKLHISFILIFASLFLWWGYVEHWVNRFEGLGIANQLGVLDQHANLNLHMQRGQASVEAGPLQPLVSWFVLGTYNLVVKPLVWVPRPELLQYEFGMRLATTILVTLGFFLFFGILFYALPPPFNYLAFASFTVCPFLYANNGIPLLIIFSLCYWALVILALGDFPGSIKNLFFPAFLRLNPSLFTFVFGFAGSWIIFGNGIAFFIGFALLAVQEKMKGSSVQILKLLLSCFLGTLIGIYSLYAWAHGTFPIRVAINADLYRDFLGFTALVSKRFSVVFIISLIVRLALYRWRGFRSMTKVDRLAQVSGSFAIGIWLYLFVRLHFSPLTRDWPVQFYPLLYMANIFVVCLGFLLPEIARHFLMKIFRFFKKGQMGAMPPLPDQS